MGPKRKTIDFDYLFSRMRVTESGCWEWTCHTVRGYGQWSNASGPHKPTHVLMWEMIHGPVPEGMKVLHKCDNRPCMAPSHLFLGTHKDNMRDMVEKGRQARGEKNGGGGKLTAAQVKEIRSLEGIVSQRKLAKRFNVHRVTIERIIYRRIWSHI